MSDETDWASVSPQSLTPEAQRVRELVLKNRVPLRDFVRGLNVSLRTGYSYIAQGMPVDYVAREPFARLPELLDWLVKRRTPKLAPPRSPGRPRKSSAS